MKARAKEEAADNAPLVAPSRVAKASVSQMGKADDDDDKPIAQLGKEAAPKAKAKASVRRALPRREATAIQKERVRQKRNREDELQMSALI